LPRKVSFMIGLSGCHVDNSCPSVIVGVRHRGVKTTKTARFGLYELPTTSSHRGAEFVSSTD
jgi:hypothetical protein